MFGWKIKESNKHRLLRVCNEFIEKYEEDSNSIIPSCKEDLNSVIKDLIDKSSDEIKNWRNEEVNYDKVAHSIIANASFDLLASGKYHLYYGILNPMNCSGSLMRVYKRTMAWGVENNQLTKDTLDEQLRYLHQRISEVG